LVREVEDWESDVEELDGFSREAREMGASWKSLKAELGL